VYDRVTSADGNIDKLLILALLSTSAESNKKEKQRKSCPQVIVTYNVA